MNSKFKDLTKEIQEEIKSEIGHTFVSGQNSVIEYLYGYLSGSNATKNPFWNKEINQKIEDLLSFIESRK